MEIEFKQAFEHLEKLSRDNYTNLNSRIKENHDDLSTKISEVKQDVTNLYERDREMFEELIELRIKQTSTQKELSEFKQSERDYGKEMSLKLMKLDGMHWKVLGVGIGLIGLFITAYKLFVR